MLTRFTPSGVRLRLHRERDGSLDWLFVPGGPGLGSESLIELVEAIDVPGRSWLVDLPGDGSNQQAPGAPAEVFDAWPHALVEAAQAVEAPIAVGHSTGGMYLLSLPVLEPLLVGLALVSSAPDARWRATFGAMTQRHPLPEVDEATRVYSDAPSIEHLRALTIASAPWSFPPRSVDAGRAMFARMPYAMAPVAWSDRAFDDIYAAAWWPTKTPTLILGGESDQIVDQTLWDDARFAGAHVAHRRIAGAGHFPWFDAPDDVRAAFAELATRAMRRE